jgi:hypothetical protein
MSSDKVELALNGSGSIADLNKDDLAAYLKAQTERESALKNAKTDASSTINPMDRSIATQHRKSVRDAKSGSFPISTKAAVKFTDRSAAHALRESIGPDPFVDIINSGNNLFLPDALFYSIIVDATDNVMTNTPKFVDAAQGYHPLYSRMYYVQLFYLRSFLAMKSAGILPTDVELELDSFLEKLKLDTWVVPGPVVDFLNSIAVSHSTVNTYGYVCPYIPHTPQYSAGTHFMGSNIAGRVPNMSILAHNAKNWTTMMQTASGAAVIETRTSARFYPAQQAVAATQANLFLGEYSPNGTPFTGAGSAFPTSPTHAGTYRTAANNLLRINLTSPFLLTPPLSNDRAVKVSMANADHLLYLFESIDTDPATLVAEWPTVLYWDNVEFWSELQSMMALYCRHLSSSLTLANLSSNGPMASHVVCELHTKQELHTRTGRFFPANTDYSFKGEVRTRSLPEADKIDATTAPVNLSRIDSVTTPGDINRPAGIAARFNRNAAHLPRLGGPFFHKIVPIQAASHLAPAAAYKEIISAQYHSQTPLRSTIPDE